MLKLKGIYKNYNIGNTSVAALRGIDLEFRENEFVCILGPSGCGKTTLLNIVGGLDQYTRGDLIINGTSTKNYRDPDWDTYRNHSIGFVFQTYNLIPHQTVLANVELALTLSGVSKAERTAQAKKVLEQVGLADQTNKRPNQLSGGQMQRVAIARALVNNPDILLADEPTGALDSETSVSIMELLKEIAKDKLIIMVTHNPDLANKYSTRIVHLLDGKVTSDSDPFTAETESAPPADKKAKKQKKPSMSLFTALSLSLNNLMTKKTRTFLTAFAGSIGIIGIALILSLSNGLQSYINDVEKDTLSSYPITLEKETVDIGGLLQSFSGERAVPEDRDPNRIYANNVMSRLLNAAVAQVTTNDLAQLRQVIEENPDDIKPLTTDIVYSYPINLNLYAEDDEGTVIQVNPSKVFEELGMGGAMGGEASGSMPFASSMMSNYNMWTEMISNQLFLETQYNLLAGSWPTAYNEVVLIVGEENIIPDLLLYSLGLQGPAELKEFRTSLIEGTQVEEKNLSYSYDDILNLSYSLILPSDMYVKGDLGWTDMSGDFVHMRKLYDNSDKIKIVGILRPNEEAISIAQSGMIGYTHALSEYVIHKTNDSAIVIEQKNDPDTDVFTGRPFDTGDSVAFESIEAVMAYLGSLPAEEQAQMQSTLGEMRQYGMTDEQILKMFNESAAASNTTATYDENLTTLGVADIENPSAINIYASSFDNKEAISDYIDNYNAGVADEYKITYTDYIGLLMSSVTTVINAISYILIAFVSISLVVSSIMIGIITYISVLERTKEIGILRSIGASKRDISRVFNAEALLIGFVAGALGILVTLLLCIPANAIILNLTEISNLAKLPPIGGVILVLISMLLSFIAGIVPARMAANKDPVVALRTE